MSDYPCLRLKSNALILQLQLRTQPLRESLLEEHCPIRGPLPVAGEEFVALRDSLPRQSEAAEAAKGALRLQRRVMGGVAPGDGESLNGAAALFTNQNV